MKRNLLTLLVVVFALGFASSAWAESRYGDGGGGESNIGCICEEVIGAGPTCTNDLLLPCGTDCNTNANCAAGSVCVDKAFTGCSSAGAGNCQKLLATCGNGGCVTSSTIENVVDCPSNIPTLSQWGLILFGMLLLTMMFWTIRRRGLPTHMSASLLVIGMFGLSAATVAYAQIQSERVCGERDVAVEFVIDILQG
ncbi:MAG: IPTL-CTERM sorting domain-containing protein [Deltaproteobacteria bacterium]|nr:IPTL-CTERM sorting domain-containing protein [Deltaproteobacteria bacterium]MBW2421705.1 IPTL-CTERM sorting domain-containing protein [Deltaproteobacteria bacterium]